MLNNVNGVYVMMCFLTCHDRYHVYMQYDVSLGNRIDDNFKQWDISSDLYYKNSTKSTIKLYMEISFKTQE